MIVSLQNLQDEYLKHNKWRGYGNYFFTEMIKKCLFSRPAESLRDRYKRFLKYISKDNIITIFRWLQNHNNAKGFLNFYGTKNSKVFSHVSMEDPFRIKKVSFSGRKQHSSPKDSDNDADIDKKEEKNEEGVYEE